MPAGIGGNTVPGPGSIPVNGEGMCRMAERWRRGSYVAAMGVGCGSGRGLMRERGPRMPCRLGAVVSGIRGAVRRAADRRAVVFFAGVIREAVRRAEDMPVVVRHAAVIREEAGLVAGIPAGVAARREAAIREEAVREGAGVAAVTVEVAVRAVEAVIAVADIRAAGEVVIAVADIRAAVVEAIRGAGMSARVAEGAAPAVEAEAGMRVPAAAPAAVRVPRRIIERSCASKAAPLRGLAQARLLALFIARGPARWWSCR